MALLPLALAGLLPLWVVALLCGLVGYLLSGALLRPLSRLETEVERGNFAQCHPDDPTDGGRGIGAGRVEDSCGHQ